MVQDSDECRLDGGAAEATTPQTVIYTPPQVSSCTGGHDGDYPSTPAPPSPGASSRSSQKGKKGLASYGKRALKGFRRFVDVDSSPGRAKQRSVAARDVSTPRSAGRTLTGRKDRSRCVKCGSSFLFCRVISRH